MGAVQWTGLATPENEAVAQPLSVKEFCALQHVIVERALVHELIDDMLAKRGYTRSIAVRITNSELIPVILDGTELVTIGWAGGPTTHGFTSFDVPLELAPTEYHLTWSDRLTNDAASIWLRQQLVEVAAHHLT
ncbi:hypothetical protein [Rhodococcus jostii]|uniref:Uncharacterized protein n=1 Tax=Rhodococcus jostii TaxID=132919 RepID=A0A1H5H967_RHOJO|nr:hypothetical protein [Rhodococcus jostii]SEE24522.1 hypothetical protein SAMN04490220_7120 [Rhodococcus jostii]